MDLDSLRSEIDAIDDELLALFLRRMQIVKDVASYKLQNGLPVLHRGREEQLLDRLGKDAGEEMAGYTRAFFEGMLAVSRGMQQEILDAHAQK